MNEKAQELFDTGLAFEKKYDFESAKSNYEEIVTHFSETTIAGQVRERPDDMDDLIEEKRIYQRIDRNGKRVLNEIGVNISESPVLMEILMEADAIDFDNDTAVFVPIKKERPFPCTSLPYCRWKSPRG